MSFAQSGGWTKVAEAVDLAEEEGARFHLKHEGRYLSLIRHKGRVFCLDAVCYHAGGPLTLGEIEEIDGKACLTCPWHMHKVSIEGGEKLYQSLEKGEGGRLVPGPWRSMGQMQRTFPAEERADGIYVDVSLPEGVTVASDKYCRNHEAGERILAGSGGSSGREDADVSDLTTGQPGAFMQGPGMAPWAGPGDAGAPPRTPSFGSPRSRSIGRTSPPGPVRSVDEVRDTDL